MNFEELISNYVFNDGKILSFTINYSDQSCTIMLQVRKDIEGEKFQKCIIHLRFSGNVILYVSEDFSTGCDYSDITFVKTSDHKYYLSLDPFGNTGKPDERDNIVIISEKLLLADEDGNEYELN